MKRKTHLPVELRPRARAPQVTRLQVLHQVARLLRAGFCDTASDKVGDDIAGLDDGEDELRDLSDCGDWVQVGRAERPDAAREDGISDDFEAVSAAQHTLVSQKWKREAGR